MPLCLEDCFRDSDWSSAGCPTYAPRLPSQHLRDGMWNCVEDQSKCSSYSESECSTSCETGKICMKLYMSALELSKHGLGVSFQVQSASLAAPMKRSITSSNVTRLRRQGSRSLLRRRPGSLGIECDLAQWTQACILDIWPQSFKPLC